MHLKRKSAELLVMAHVEVWQPSQREIRDDSPKLVEVSRVLTRRRFLLRDQYKLTLRDQQCASRSKLSLESAENSRPLYGGGQSLPFGPITLDLCAEFYR